MHPSLFLMGMDSSARPAELASAGRELLPTMPTWEVSKRPGWHGLSGRGGPDLLPRHQTRDSRICIKSPPGPCLDRGGLPVELAPPPRLRRAPLASGRDPRYSYCRAGRRLHPAAPAHRPTQAGERATAGNGSADTQGAAGTSLTIVPPVAHYSDR